MVVGEEIDFREFSRKSVTSFGTNLVQVHQLFTGKLPKPDLES